MAATASVLFRPNPEAQIFFSTISESVKNAMKDRRPWMEFIDPNTFSKPESFAKAATRIRKNWSHFRINYAIVLCAAVGFSLVLHPLLLSLLMIVLGGWLLLYFLYSGPLVLYNRHLSQWEILGILTIISAAIVFFSDVVSVVIYAAMLGFVIVCGHGAFQSK